MLVKGPVRSRFTDSNGQTEQFQLILRVIARNDRFADFPATRGGGDVSPERGRPFFAWISAVSGFRESRFRFCC